MSHTAGAGGLDSEYFAEESDKCPEYANIPFIGMAHMRAAVGINFALAVIADFALALIFCRSFKNVLFHKSPL